MTNKNGPGPSTVQPLYEIKHSPPKTHYRTAYGPRQRLSIAFPENGRTKQEFKNECDINTIMARFDKTGILAFTNRFQPQYGDATGIEFQNSMETIAAGRSMFQELPSAIRARFQNDPARFLDFVHDERNAEEMREMGLLRPSDAQATPLPKRFSYITAILDALRDIPGEKHCELRLAIAYDGKEYTPTTFFAKNVWWRGVSDLTIVEGGVAK